jgi:hypothetical protein
MEVAMAPFATLASRGGLWRRLFASNVAAASANFVSGGLAARIGTNPFTSGTNLAILDPGGGAASGRATPNSVLFRFFGTDASNETFSARIWGIEEGVSDVVSTATRSWQPTLLAELAITLGDLAGVAGTLIVAADFEADTIALTYGASQDIVLVTTTDVRQAWARIDFLGFPILAVEFDDGGSAASCNGLYRWVW